MSVSIIIPVLNDNEELSSLFETIKTWKQQPLEIIVVDAKADLQCKKICQENNAKWLAYNRTRGAQQRFGAHHARGNTLWFLYADCRPPMNALKAIEYTVENHRGGFFKFAFDLPSLNLTQKILEFFTNWRSQNFIAYGDQGLFFDKQAYFVLDGHADQTLFEEVNLIKKIKPLGFKALNLKIRVSPRKWQRDGFWKRTWQNRRLALRYHFGSSPDELQKQYYPE